MSLGRLGILWLHQGKVARTLDLLHAVLVRGMASLEKHGDLRTYQPVPIMVEYEKLAFSCCSLLTGVV